jgi:hypothetical protein
LEQPLLDDSACCRICHFQDDEPLLSPCWCAGSVQYVCRDCLNYWHEKKKASGQADDIRSCELCGLAFLYETERAPITELVRLLSQRSWRCFVLLFCTVYYHAMYLQGRDVAQPAPLFLAAAILGEFCYDVFLSSGQPHIGSSGYSWKRMLAVKDADAIDLWALHKAEWAQDGLAPFEELPMRGPSPCTSITMAAGGSVLMNLILLGLFDHSPSLPVVPGGERLIPGLQKMDHLICRPLCALGLFYLVSACLLHTLSLIRNPPIRLVTDSDEKPLVRSLKKHEQRCKVDSTSFIRVDP